MAKYKVIYNQHTFEDVFDSKDEADNFAFNDAENTIRGNLYDIIRSEVDDCYEVIEVKE